MQANNIFWKPLGIMLLLIGLSGGIWAFFIAEKSGVALSMAVIAPYLGGFPFLLFALGCLGLFGIGVVLVFGGNPDPH